MKQNATLIGMTAVLFWSTMAGMIRSVTEAFGAVGGAALLYTLCALLLLPILGVPKVHKFPKNYLVLGSILFVAYELCLSLSLGYANSNRQAIEVSLVNYLWPSLTVLLSSLVSNKKYSHWITLGIAFALGGLAFVIGGDQALDVRSIASNIQDNPLSYGLAFSGAIIWSVYSVATNKMAKGHNGVVLFFTLTAITLWTQYFRGNYPPIEFSVTNTLSVLMAAVFLGLGYAAWNYGVLYGNASTMASASYFTPVLSSALASLILATALPLTFWYGTGLICIGSIACIRGGRVSSG